MDIKWAKFYKLFLRGKKKDMLIYKQVICCVDLEGDKNVSLVI